VKGLLHTLTDSFLGIEMQRMSTPVRSRDLPKVIDRGVQSGPRPLPCPNNAMVTRPRFLFESSEEFNFLPCVLNFMQLKDLDLSLVLSLSSVFI
jgi:hypothetical protein